MTRKSYDSFKSSRGQSIRHPGMREQEREKSSRRRGSALMEGVLAMLPLLAVMFTVLDLSIAIFVKNTVQFAVCQGVRYAVTSQTLPGLGQDASIKSVVQGYTLGLLDALSADHVGRTASPLPITIRRAWPPSPERTAT